jgi:hypothetical protein
MSNRKPVGALDIGYPRTPDYDKHKNILIKYFADKYKRITFTANFERVHSSTE